MEIQTAPRSPASTPWGRLVLFVVLFGPVMLLVLLPIGLGLQRYVMTGSSMAGAIDRGSIAFERVVPISDLRVGDVITYAEPGATGDSVMVTHRIVSIQPDGIRTRGDALEHVDPWVLDPEAPTMSRVEFTVPWVGWAYLVLFHSGGLVLTIVSAAALVLLLSRRLRRAPAPVRGASAGGTLVEPAAGTPVTRVNGRDPGKSEAKR